MKKTTKSTTTIVDTYHLSKDIKVDVTTINGEESKRMLRYTGKNLHGYGLKPIYKFDRTTLNKENPFHVNKWPTSGEITDIGDISMDDIIFSQVSTHSLFELDKSPIPLILPMDYIQCNIENFWYDLEKLRDYLKGHENVVSCSEILDIPYYNAGENRNKYLEVQVLPKKEWLVEYYAGGGKGQFLEHLSCPYSPKGDYLDIDQFKIRNNHD